MKSLASTFLILGLILATSGCATKRKVQTITAAPIRTSVVGPVAREIQRTSPGEVMDPHATVFAQVPKRIIFLPGENRLTGRTSPEQVAAYSLVKVSELPEIQSGQPTTVMLTNPEQLYENNPDKIVNMTISETSVSEEGTARELRVKAVEKIDFARTKIRKGETLKFIEDIGWVGWIPKGGNPQPKEQRIPPALTSPTENSLPKLPPSAEAPEPTLDNPPAASPTPTPNKPLPPPLRLSPAQKQ